jgi:hypothetical protein
MIYKLFPSHGKDCDCIICCKGGRIDQAILALKKELLGMVGEEEIVKCIRPDGTIGSFAWKSPKELAHIICSQMIAKIEEVCG